MQTLRVTHPHMPGLGIPPAMQQDDAPQKRFIREARSAAAQDHPCICSIHEVGESNGREFIVMEYVAGQSPQGPAGAGFAPADGDIMVLHTDGLREQQDGEADFCRDRLEHVLREVKHEPSKTVFEALGAELYAYCPPKDDLTLAVIRKVRPSFARTPSDRSVRRVLSRPVFGPGFQSAVVDCQVPISLEEFHHQETRPDRSGTGPRQ